MGCNCKSKINRRYTDGKDDGRERRSRSGVVFHKTINIFLYLLVMVFAVALIPFALPFVLYKGFRGEKASLKTPFMDKIKKTGKGWTNTGHLG